MKIGNPDLLLLLIRQMKRGKGDQFRYSGEEIADSLGIKVSSVAVYLSKLSTSGLIVREKKKFTEDPLDNITVTDEGKERLELLSKEIDGIEFTPERHSIASIISYRKLEENISDPLDRIFLISIHSKMYTFDLFGLVSALGSMRKDTEIHNLFSDDDGYSTRDLHRSMYDMSLYGDIIPDESELSPNLLENDTNTLIILAETLTKKGEFDRSEMVYRNLLSAGRKITQGQWLHINIGLVNIYRKRGETERVMKMLDDLENQTANKLYKAYINHFKALEMGHSGNYRESIEMFGSVIATFHAYGNPLLLFIGYGNRGFMFFVNGMRDLAEKDWKTARRYAIQAGSKNSEAKILINLADIEILKGNPEKGLKYIEKAEKTFEHLGDLDSITLIHYNKALYHLAVDDREGALREYREFWEVGQSIHSPSVVKILKHDFIERAKEYGIEDVEKDI